MGCSLSTDGSSAPKAGGDAASGEVKIKPVSGKLAADTKIVFVLGGPGSGKGTQCERIVAKYGYKHLSAGDLLRDEVKSGSSAGKMCDTLMKEGKLVPMGVTITLLKNAMIKSKAKKFLIDGFPRALDQANAFEEGIMPCQTVLFFDCPEATMEERLLNRGLTSGRADDNAETIKKRFKTFVEASLPVIDHYKGKGKCHSISAVPGPDVVFEEVVKALDPLEEKKAEKKPEPKKEAPAAPAAAAAPVEIKVPEVAGSLPEDSSIVFVLGGPGSGKGTQCERIVAKYGYKHLSAGDLLRDEVKSGSEVGKMCDTLMKEGKLVPMSVTIALLKNAMISSGASKFLIDGFPRALDQANAFEEGIKKCQAVLFFDCPEATMEERLLNRGLTSGRADDNAETIKKRFKTFVEASVPVVDHYKAEGKCHEISSVPTPDEVFEEVVKALEPLQA